MVETFYNTPKATGFPTLMVKARYTSTGIISIREEHGKYIVTRINGFKQASKQASKATNDIYYLLHEFYLSFH